MDYLMEIIVGVLLVFMIVLSYLLSSIFVILSRILDRESERILIEKRRERFLIDAQASFDMDKL